MSAPRTWTLGAYRGEWEKGGIASGPKIKNESIEVIEVEPILDLLEGVVRGVEGEAGRFEPSPTELRRICEDANILLHEHGRLEELDEDDDDG